MLLKKLWKQLMEKQNKQLIKYSQLIHFSKTLILTHYLTFT